MNKVFVALLAIAAVAGTVFMVHEMTKKNTLLVSPPHIDSKILQAF
jgi:hypothetical protein